MEDDGLIKWYERVAVAMNDEVRRVVLRHVRQRRGLAALSLDGLERRTDETTLG
jgi:hypothetical protein